jgi:hypothetical protein
MRVWQWEIREPVSEGRLHANPAHGVEALHHSSSPFSMSRLGKRQKAHRVYVGSSDSSPKYHISSLVRYHGLKIIIT